MIVERERTKQFAFPFLLSLSLVAALIVPMGLDIALCFSKYGRVKISAYYCTDKDSSKPQTVSAKLLDRSHQNECIDLLIVCDSSRDPINYNKKSGISKSIIKKSSRQTSVALSGTFTYPQSIIKSRTSFFLVKDILPPSHLRSLQTIVLLI